MACRRSPRRDRGAVANRELEADVLSPAKEIERAERRRWVRRVEEERPHHPPRTGEAQGIGLRPAGRCEGAAELGHRPDQGEINGVTWQAVARDRVTGN